MPVPAPSVPAPPAPLPQLPVPVPTPPPAQAAPSVPSLPAAQAPAAPVPAAPGSTSARALGQAIGGATSEVASAPAQFTPGRTGQGNPRTSRAWKPGERRRVRRLRREVRPYRACFSVLTHRSRRILQLHLGLHPARRPHSRAAIASRFHTSTRRVARSEHRAIVQLRRAARNGQCGADLSFATAGGGAEGASAFGVSFVASVTGAEDGDRIGVGGVRDSGGSGDGSRKRSPALPGGTGFVNNVGDDLREIAGIVIALLAAALALTVLGLHRKGALERPAWLRKGD